MTNATPPTPSDRRGLHLALAVALFAIAMALLLASASGCSPRRHHLRLPNHPASS